MSKRRSAGLVSAGAILTLAPLAFVVSGDSRTATVGAALTDEARLAAPQSQLGCEDPAVWYADTDEDSVEWVPTADDLAQWAANETQFAAALEAAGIEFTLTIGELGIPEVEYDLDDPVANAVVSAYYDGQYPRDAAMAAELNADAVALAGHLDAAGVAYTTRVNGWGITVVEYDANDPAAQAAEEAYSVEKYPLAPELIAKWSAQSEGLAADFEAAGVAYTLSVDSSGVTRVDYDGMDPAAMAVVQKRHATLNPLPPEVIQMRTAEAQRLATALAEAGIAHSLSEDAWGVPVVEFDHDDPAASAVVNVFYGRDPDAC